MSDTSTFVKTPLFPVTMAATIADLAMQNLSFRRSILVLTEEKKELTKKIDELEKSLSCSVSFEYFSTLIKRYFKEGKIPAPKDVCQFNRPIDLICEDRDVKVHHDGVFIQATFDSNGYSNQVRFKFVPIPARESEVTYPDFFMSYEKPLVKNKASPRVKKPKAATPPAP